MKSVLAVVFSFCVFTAFAQSNASGKFDSSKATYTAEAACGQCQFKLKGKGCSLAVRINGQAYFVDGTDIDSHGDAHASDGFCNKIRKANVQGEIVENRYKANYFQLLPEKVKEKHR